MSGFFITGRDAAQAEADSFDRASGRTSSAEPSGPGALDGIAEINLDPRRGAIGVRFPQIERGFQRGLAVAGIGIADTAYRAGRIVRDFQDAGASITGLPDIAPAPGAKTWWEDFTTRAGDYSANVERQNRADPNTVGVAAQMTNDISSMLTAGVVGNVAGPVGSGAVLGTGFGGVAYRDFKREGVSEDVARRAASIEGGFMAAMGVLPAAVPSSASTLTRRVIERGITGAGINFATGLGMRYSMNSYLAANGYEEIAKRYEPWDTTSVATDLILGAAFGGLLGPRSGPRTRPRTEADGPALDGEPENGPMPWNADDYHTSAREHAQAGNLAEAYADATIAEERGAEGAAETRRMILEEIAQREDADAIEMQAARALEVARMEDAEANFDVKSADEVAAALIMEGERRAAMEEPPGIPLDGEAARAHARAMEQAEAQASRDEDIDVTGTGVETADFLPRPDDIEIMAMDVEQALASLAGDQPKTLTQWVRSQGGIADDRGDLAPLMQGKRGFASILRRTGRSVDDLALAAWEQGWFPELVERPTVNEFLDAIAGEDKGSIRTADVGRVSEIRDAQQVINYYESKGVDTSLQGEALREAIRANMVGREEEAFDALAEVLRDAGYSDLVGEVERLRAIAAEQGQPINPDDIAFSMGMERFRDSRLSEQENKAVEMLRNGFDRASIADELDISNDQLRVVLAKARKKAPDVNIERQAGGRPNFQLARIRSLVSKGIPDAAIAERLGITLGNVRTAKWKLRAKGDFFASMGRSPGYMVKGVSGDTFVVMTRSRETMNRIMAEQRRAQEPVTARWLIHEGQIHAWDGNKALHADVARQIGVRMTEFDSIVKGEANSFEDTAEAVSALRGQMAASIGRSPLFRSAVETAISGEKAPKKGDASAWMSFLRNASGVKKEELDWIGLEEFLKARESDPQPVVYHAGEVGDGDFDLGKFGSGKFGNATKNHALKGFHFAPTEAGARRYGDPKPYVIEGEAEVVNLPDLTSTETAPSASNGFVDTVLAPYVERFKLTKDGMIRDYWETRRLALDAYRDDLIARGKTHVIFKSPAQTEYVVFDPKNIRKPGKSKTAQISREEVLSFVKANGVRVEETVLGAGLLRGAPTEGRRDEIQRELLPLIEERDRLESERVALVSAAPNGVPQGEAFNRWRQIGNRRNELNGLIDALSDEFDALPESATATKWSTYTLPGGENYRELLLRLPVAETLPDGMTRNARGEIVDAVGEVVPADSPVLQRAKPEQGYRSSHWDESNVLAHIRFKERIAYESGEPNGSRVAKENFFAGQMQGVLPLEIMQSVVVRLAHHDQVQRAIVGAIPVDVVNILRDLKFAPKDLFSKNAMSLNAALSALDRDVQVRFALGLSEALGKTHARIRAEMLVALRDPKGISHELLPALRATDLDASEIRGLLSGPESVSQGGAEPNSLGLQGRSAGETATLADGGGARAGTPFSAADNARLVDRFALASLGTPAALTSEVSPASVTDFLNRHAKIVAQNTGNRTPMRVLAIEEVQSDWHQAGRERGYKGIDTSGWTVEEGRSASGAKNLVVKNARGEPLFYAREDQYTPEQAIELARQQEERNAVPDAPFKDNKWAALSLKRMIRWAAENGFDAIAWIPGDVKNGKVRPDGKATLLELSADGRELRTDDGTYRIVEKNPNDNERTLSSVVGEAAAKQLLAADAIAKGPLKGVRRLEGNFVLHNVQGWEFYDKILVNAANDIGKKYDARVEGTEIDTTVSTIHAYPSGETWRIGDRSRGGGPVENTPTFKTKEAAEAWIAENMNRKTLHTLPLTDALREAASEGLPLFSRGGGQGVEASLLTARLLRYFGGDFTKLVESAQVKIVDGVDDVPGLREKLNELGTIREPGAVHDYRNKTTYMIASNIEPLRASGVMLHEVGYHAGIEGVLGSRIHLEVQKRLIALHRAGNPIVREAFTQAELFRLRPSQLLSERGAYTVELAIERRGMPIEADVANMEATLARAERAGQVGKKLDGDMVKRADDALAWLIDNAPDFPIVRKVLANIRQWLWREFGSDFGANLTIDDIRSLAVAALRRVAREAVRKDMGFENVDAVAATIRSTGNRNAPAELPDPGSPEYAEMLAAARAKEAELGTPALSELEKRIVRQNRDPDFKASFKRNPDPAKQAMEDDPGMRIATPDGVRPAADILMDAEEAVKAAREMQEGFAAAASCAAQIGTGAATRGASRAFAALATGNAIGAAAALPLGMVAAPFLAEDNRRQIRNRLVPQRFKPTFGEAYYPDEAMSGATYTTEDTFYRGSERHGTESRAADYDMGGANRFEGGAYVPPADAPEEEQ